jgi:ABC-2 type transport system permease protein
MRRETYRFARLFRQTIVPPVINTVMYILIFGYSLGASIRKIDGHDYIIYILPGLAQLGVINNAYANTSTSIFMARLERSIENVLVAPLHYLEIVIALMLGGILRGLTVGAATLAISAIFVDLPMPHPFWLLISWVLTSALFSALGFISALMAENWDHIALFTNFIITPAVYLGGTFYSVKTMSPLWQSVMKLNPIFYCIDSTRFAILGGSDSDLSLSFGIIAVLGLIAIAISVQMIKRGYKLIA